MLYRTLLGATMAVGLAGAAHAQAVGIATSNPGSLYHNVGSAIASVASEEGLNTTIQPATSPNQYLPVVATGELEFGLSNLDEFLAALNGEQHFEGRPHPDLRVLGLLYPLRAAIFVRADSDIESIEDLRGRPMVDGFTAQRTIIPLLDALYATAGMTRDDMQGVQVPSVVAGADEFMAGRTDGFFFALGAGKVREADASVGGIRALPIEDDEATLQAIREHWPTGYIEEVQPGPGGPGIDAPTHVMAYPMLVFTSAHVDDDTVYEMTRIIHENKEGMAAIFPPFNGFNPDEHMTADAGTGEFHPGAIRFYEEKGIWPGT
jgi:uncharacterized protein